MKADRPVARFLLLFVLILLLLVLRRPDAITNPQFWAEDGLVFFGGQTMHPGFGLLLQPHAGYLQLAPRLIAVLAYPFSPLAAPLIYNLCALIIASLCCCLFSLNRYRYLLASDPLRILLCLLIATALQADEVVATVACLHVFLFFAALLAILDGRSYPLALAALIAGLSEPVVVILLPLGVWMAVKRRSLSAIAVIAAGIVQIGFFLASGGRGGLPLEYLDAILTGSAVAILYRVALSPLLGLSIAQSLSGPNFTIAVLLTAMALGLWLAVLWRYSSHPQRRHLITALYLIAASVAMAIAGRSMAKSYAGPVIEWRGERYFLAGGCLFAYLVALSIERWMAREHFRVLMLAAFFAPGVYGNFRLAPFIDYHWPHFAPKVQRWEDDRRAKRTPRSAVIPINPPPLFFELPGRLELPPGVADGMVIRRAGLSAEDGKVYVILAGRRQWVLSGQWLKAHGYRWPEDVRVVSAETLDDIPAGPPIQ